MNTLPNTIEHTTCRLCGSDSIVFLYSLGDLFVSNFADSREDAFDENKFVKAPLEMVLCEDCSLVQLRHTTPSELLYTGNYWYRSGTTETMRIALARIAVEATNHVSLEKGDIVLDIGSNDGTFLANFPSHFVRVGCEPAKNLNTAENYGDRGLQCLPELWTHSSFRKKFGDAKAKVITALGMLYDLEDPSQFMADVAEVLHPEGVFITQLMCLPDMVEMNDVGNIVHEHLEYYSYQSIAYLFETNHLQVVDVERNNVNGKSTRFICKRRSRGDGHCLKMSERSRQACITHHKAWILNVCRNLTRLSTFIQDTRLKGKTVWVYGASTKGNTILQLLYRDGVVLDGACDKNPSKHGKYTVGTGIRIVSEEEARTQNPDYFLVLPYTFLQEFIERESDFLDRGGKFIVPLPELRVIGKETLS